MDWSFTVHTGLLIVLLAFIAEYFDSTLGMGYGTSLTPILLIMGFEPMQIVPCILLSELITGLGASVMHDQLGNVNLFPREIKNIKINRLSFLRDIRKYLPDHLKIGLLIGICSIIGAVAAVYLAVNLPKFLIKLYIGILITLMGILILLTSGSKLRFSWSKIIILSIIASFNKGISGGGYGPVVTSGQLLSGVNSKNAIGITSFAESLTCLVGLMVYLLLKNSVDWKLAPFLILGGILSIPVSGITVKKMKMIGLKNLIGVVTLFLGLFTLYKIL